MPAQCADVIYALVCEQSAFGEHEVANFGSLGDDALDCIISDEGARGEVEHAKVLKGPGNHQRGEVFVGRRGRRIGEWIDIHADIGVSGRVGLGRSGEGSICELYAVRETHLAHVGAVGPYIADGKVCDELAVVEIDFEQQGAIEGEGGDWRVCEELKPAELDASE